MLLIQTLTNKYTTLDNVKPGQSPVSKSDAIGTLVASARTRIPSDGGGFCYSNQYDLVTPVQGNCGNMRENGTTLGYPALLFIGKLFNESVIRLKYMINL